MIRVTIWNEYRHEQHDERVRAVYPDGIHAVIAAFVGAQADMRAATATLDMPEHGLTEAVLAETDVLLWWGHQAHQEVSDAVVERVRRRVLDGMGLIVLHSGHASKVFRALLGTDTSRLRWREDGDMSRLWVMDPTHPIAQGLGDSFVIPRDETYGEHFGIPTPDELVLLTWWQGGEVFRSGCCWRRGLGRLFYFQPGHETFPVYYQEEVQRVILNAIRWAHTEVRHVPVTGHVTRP